MHADSGRANPPWAALVRQPKPCSRCQGFNAHLLKGSFNGPRPQHMLHDALLPHALQPCAHLKYVSRHQSGVAVASCSGASTSYKNHRTTFLGRTSRHEREAIQSTSQQQGSCTLHHAKVQKFLLLPSRKQTISHIF
jgi:hypothetical protein